MTGEKQQVDIGRYRRQITLDGFGLDAQQALADAHVAVLGAGGLGSPALVYLAACGVGTVTVIDDDVVETSNLHRQVIHTDASVGESKATSARREMLARNPGMTVHTVADRLTADNAVDLLRGADVLLDGTDNFAARYAASHGSAVLGIPHVWASILGFDAQLSVFGATLADGSAGPVYEDVFPTPPPAGTVPSCSAAGVLGPVVGVVGTAMALEAVKVLTGVGQPLAGELGYFDGLSGRWEYIPLTADPAVAARVQDAPTPVAEELAVEESDGERPDLPDLTDAVLMDVREPDEFHNVHIPGAVNIPLSVLRGGVDGEFPEEAEYLADRATQEGRPLVVYCGSGVRSLKAIDLLATAGITASNYPGGINAWLERQ
ncbi:MAG TPA: ThiF family adenylyltransferase [Candidatus Corynebacterium avicola]|uniref:ThiF family adenylyltransferase n=1 Tax=Candidatus Corynebacterium avicola TaxID=2838527 RepID=A0A9D1RMT3_9CORY|nr:ThiF family adenylyltransferase [Candidatus Corynebacterium avicola]